ncbi:MAG: tetratricopeptide repeat protein [Ktedonobacteraceae bacterium]|nr:tetratricopeptide repeat protein [Ktedonobacteraceae bacterium]
MNSKVTYRQQYTRCGKQRCRKCREGTGHGPYWYAYWSEKGRTVSKYVGTHLPAELARTGGTQFVAPAAPIAPENIASRILAPVENIDKPPTQPFPSPLLRVYVLGQFRVERKNGGEWATIDSRIWHRRRARALLGCLLSSPGRRSSREQVMEVLWPDLDIDVAANRLNGAVHELRQILEPEIARPAASRMLRLERDILEIADSTQIWVDAEAFEQLLKEANNCSDPAEAERLLEDAAALYRGGYLLEELYSEWAAPRRDTLQRAWIGLLLDLANLRAERGMLASAIETLDRLRTAEPTNETALQRLMILLTQLDRRGEALQVYRQYMAMLQRDGEGDPLPETQQLYEELLQGKLPSVFHSKMGINTSKERETPVYNSPPVSPSPTPTLEPLFTRPVLHLGRHNQSPLIGRQRELEIMQQVMLTLEGRAFNAGQFPSPSGMNLVSAGSSGNTSLSSRSSHASSVSTRPRQPHFLLLMGEPGIGKTRLAEELSLAAYTRDWAVAWSRSYEQEGTIPYRPWTELLRTLLQSTTTFEELLTASGMRTSAHATPFKIERLGPLLPGFSLPGREQADSYNRTSAANPVPHEQERLHLWEATLGLLDTLSAINPLLLVFDDLHWADDSSIELLTYLVHHLQDQRVLLLATCRDAELPSQHKIRTLIADLQREQAIVTLSVQPLSQSQIGALVSHLPQDVIQSIQTQAAGNPFFAEELARYVEMVYTEEEGAIKQVSTTSIAPPRNPGRTSSPLPEAIAAVLERRLGRLSSDCQALLGKAAVLGGSFELGQLLPMASEHTEDVVLDLLDEALYAGLLTEDGVGVHITYHFWHPLIISHLYERLSAARRAQFHRKAAEAIKGYEASDMPAEKVAAAIVYHLSKGGGNPADMAYYAELAGNQAYAIAAYSEAQQYYLQTIHAMVEIPSNVGARFISPSQFSEGNNVHISIRRLTPQIISQLSFATIQHVCWLLERIAECNIVQGNFEDVRYLYQCVLDLRTSKEFQQHITSLASDTSAQLQQEVQSQALLWREIGNTWKATGEYARAYECYGRGKEVLRNAGITTGIAWACLHLQYGAMLRIDGHYHEARRYLQEALTMLENIIHPATHHVHTNGIAQPLITQPLKEYSPVREYGLVNSDSMHPGEGQHQFPKVLYTRLERALQGDPFELGYAHEQFGIALASSGPLSEGLGHMHIALTIYEQSELLPQMARICSNLGAAYIAKGEQTLAREHLHRSLELAERIGDLPSIVPVTANLGDIAQRVGNLLEAEEWFKRSLDVAQRIIDREGISWSSVELANVQRDLGKMEEAKASIFQALITAHAIKSPRCVRYALVGLGELRMAQALLSCPYEGQDNTTPINQPALDSQRHSTHEAPCKRLLLRARSTLQRALSLDELDIEAFSDGKHLLATAYYLLDDVKLARQTALQTLKDARENETGRTAGRANRLLGRILMNQGQYEQADLYFEQAITIFREGGLRLDYARTLYTYGAILLQRGSDEHAPIHRDLCSPEEREVMRQRGIGYLHEARRIFINCHASVDLTLIEHIFARLEERTI